MSNSLQNMMFLSVSVLFSSTNIQTFLNQEKQSDWRYVKMKWVCA